MARLTGAEAAALKAILDDIELFSRRALGMPLYPYQVEPLRAVIDSVINGQGREFLLIFPRQSGKNEAIAHLLVYLLFLFQRSGGQIVYGAVGDGLGRGMRRLEERLDNPLMRAGWVKARRPLRYTVGRAGVVFISSHPGAAARGETADHLLIIDEAQDHDPAHIEAVFTPMRAAHNATALYLGTVRARNDFLWSKKRELEAAQAVDGQRRVFVVPPETVIADNQRYGAFLAEQIRRHGRQHPIIAAEYFLEPLEGDGRLFPAARLAMMGGVHPRLRTPCPGETYLATIDLAGGDPAAGSGDGTLDNPRRDFTAGTIFRLTNEDAPLPAYEAVDVFIDHGSPHFSSAPGRTALAERLLAWLRHWNPAHTLIDAGGVGQGVADWLTRELGRGAVTAYVIHGAAAKARLGSDFIALIDTGRFHYWSGDEEQPLSDGWWFWQQAAACTYGLPRGGRFDRELRWSVPDSARVGTRDGSQPLHDDRLLSAALIAEVERRRAAGGIVLARGRSRVLPPGEG